MIKYVDLFAGMGGIRIGLTEAAKELNIKTKCIATSEIKKHAISILKENFKDIEINGDVTSLKIKKDFDILLAGFPCQAFSAAGNRDGFCDTRGTLFFEVERILKESNPKAFILENVEGLVTHDKGNTLKTIINSLENLNYQTSWKIFDSKDFGLAQSRKRIYIVGTKTKKINLSKITKKEEKTLKDIMELNQKTVDSQFTKKLLNNYNLNELDGKAIKDKRGGENNIHSWDIELKGKISLKQKELLNKLFKERRKKHWAQKIGIEWMDGMPLTTKQIKTFINYKNIENDLKDLINKGYLKLEYPKKINIENNIKRRVYDETKEKGYNIITGKLSFEFTKILDRNDITPTIVASDMSKLAVIDKTGIRKLTKREGLRLFGFPEEYTMNSINEAKSFDLLGNTVAVSVIKEIAKEVLNEI